MATSVQFRCTIGDRITFSGSSALVFRGGVPVAIIPWRRSLLKSAMPIPEGARWITVNASGVEGAGHPVLIKPQPDGSAIVIGGAGGKLNQLRLNRIGDPNEWKERAKKRKVKEKERKESQSEDEQAEEKAAKLTLKEKQVQLRKENAIATVKALDSSDINHGLTDDQINALSFTPDLTTTFEERQQQQQLADEAIAHIKAIHQAYEYKLATDHATRAAALAGDGDNGDRLLVQNGNHIAAGPEGKELSNLQKLPDGQWLVNGPGGAQQFENWADAANHHLANVLQAEQLDGGIQTQPNGFYKPSEWVADISTLPNGIEFNVQAARDIAALSGDRKAGDRAIRQASSEIKRKPASEVLEGLTSRIEDITKTDVIAKLESDAKTLSDAFKNNGFLDLADEVGDAAKIRGHAVNGGYGKLAAIASDILKVNPLDRQLVDMLGYNESARLLAYQIRETLSPEDYERAAIAQAAYHAETSANIADATTKRVQPMADSLKHLHEQILMLEQLSDGSPEDLVKLDSMTYEAEQLSNGIQQIIGTTLGELQASAAMSAALEGRAKTLTLAGKQADKVTNALPGVVGGESGETKFFDAYGLTPEDYKLSKTDDGRNGVQILPSGLEKLAGAVSSEDREAYERAIAIKRGDFDEENFVPAGFSHYMPLSTSDATTEAQKFDVSLGALDNLKSGGEVSDDDLKDSLSSYVGARAANGENPLSILNDVRSPSFYVSQGMAVDSPEALRVQGMATDLVAQMAGGEQGNWSLKISDSAMRSAARSLGEVEASKHRLATGSDDLQALHSQQLDEEHGIEAAHRTLASMPLAKVAFKEKLSGRDRKQLREFGITEVLGWELEQEPDEKKPAVESQLAEVQYDLFGNAITASDYAAETLDDDEPDNQSQWAQFTRLMGGSDKAYAAVTDHLRGQYLSKFAAAYGSISGKPILTGQEAIAHVDRLELAKLPEAKRQELIDEINRRSKSEIAGVQKRGLNGKWTEDPELLERLAELKGNNSQLSLLTSGEQRDKVSTGLVQRSSIGSAAEAQLKQLMGKVVTNFEQIESPVGIYNEVNWGKGTDHATKQRALKFLEQQGKVGLHFGAGSGKTATILGAFTHLHSQGKARKLLFSTPSSVVGQAIGEAVTFLQPGKYNYNANLGMSREERLRSLADPDNHIHITTRESLTADLLHLVEKHGGINNDQFRELSEADQREAIATAAKKEGIDVSSLMFAVDEAHDITARTDNDPSNRSLVLNHLGYHSPYYVQATADLMKNDLGEVYSFLHSVAPEKFSDRSKFLKEYGHPSARRALQRAVAPYSYSAATKPKHQNGDRKGQLVRAKQLQPKIPVNDHIAGERQKILDDVKLIGQWRSQHQKKLKAANGENYQASATDFNEAWNEPTIRDALDRMASESGYGGMSPEDKQQAIGRQIMAIGALKQTAMNRLFQRTPFEQNPKAQFTVDACLERFKQGKPGVVFSASTEAAEMLSKQLSAKGMRVAYIHGGLNSQQKSQERSKFQNGEADILLSTDAGRTGLNLQKGKYLIHYDQPMTEMGWSQRSARIHRLGQQDDVEILTPQFDVPEERVGWERIERKGRDSQPVKSRADMLDESGLARKIQELKNAA